jgi:hypothetical protein
VDARAALDDVRNWLSEQRTALSQLAGYNMRSGIHSLREHIAKQFRLRVSRRYL